MKKYILRILLFFFIVAVADQLLGAGLMYMRRNAGSGSAREIEYTTRQCNEDVLVFGSSRAMHHYVPSIIEDSLGMTCFNCGKDGLGLYYNYGRWMLIREHHIPKVIVYDYCHFDHEVDSVPNNRFLTELRPYCGNPGVKELFNDVESMEKYKVASSLYRNNSKLLQLIGGFVKREKMTDGYRPLKGEIYYFYKIKPKPDVDTLKYRYLEKFIQSVQHDGVKLIFMLSPYYDGVNASCPPEIQELFRKYKVDFYDNENLEGFTNNKSLFRDMKHLNEKGAEKYTKIVVGEIRKSMERQSP